MKSYAVCASATRITFPPEEVMRVPSAEKEAEALNPKPAGGRHKRKRAPRRGPDLEAPRGQIYKLGRANLRAITGLRACQRCLAVIIIGRTPNPQPLGVFTLPPKSALVCKIR